MADVAINSVRKSYGDVEVLHGIDLHVPDGEFVVLVGPSGCGKSTLLRMIAGLERITGGTIAIGDRVVNHVAPKDRDIAMVFQSYALYPHKTVAENMGFALKLKGVSKADIQTRVEEAAAILSLTPFLKRYPRQLSGGQRQRVAMGRAIVRDPQVFLFDEPLSNLDAKLRVAMRKEIKELHGRLGTTTIFVTHDQVEAMTMADRIVVMQGGHVEQVGTPLELYDTPANLFVATFIGSPAMNLLDATAENGRVRLASGAVLPVATDASGPVVFGIRPEHLALVGPSSGIEGAIEATVSVVEPTGSETIVFARTAGARATHGEEREEDGGDGEIVAVFRERHPLRPGETIHLAPQGGHVFDARTGLALTAPEPARVAAE